MRKMMILLFSLVTMALAVGCQTKESLSPLESALDQILGYGSVDAHFCSSAPAPGKQKIKYLFVLDHSSSNKPGFPPPLCNPGEVLVTNVSPNACWTLCGNMTSQAEDPNNGNACVNITTDVTNTDADGARRYGPLKYFVNLITTTPDPNNLTSFDLIDFNSPGTAYQAQNLGGFDTDATDFIDNRVNCDWAGLSTPCPGTLTEDPNDGGFTDYDGAIQQVISVIKNDAQLEAATASVPIVQSQYVVIFVSDGVPTIPVAGGVCTEAFTTSACGVNSIRSDLIGTNGLMNLKNNPLYAPYISSISFNTAYYYDAAPDPFAQAILGQMADAGNGQYIEFGSGQDIAYERFAPPARNIVNQLADVFVENMNGVWWDDGRFMADTDGDGLPDLIEEQYGSDPLVQDTDGNGVSDFVEFRTKGKPCNDAACKVSKRDPYAMCAGYGPATDANGRVTFNKTNNDGLNDCERFLLGGQVGNFTSAGDLVPDFLGAVNFLPILPGSAGTTFSDPFGDGYDNYTKLKLGLPTQVSMKTLPDIKLRNTSLTIESRPSADVACYHYTVGGVALSATQNLIRMMVIQNTSTIQDKPFMTTATRPMEGGLATFSASDFQ